MKSLNLIETFAEFKETKNIDRPTLMRVLEDVLRGMIRKRYESDENFDLIINTDKGDVEIWQRREIVLDNETINEVTQIAYSDAIKIEPDFEIGEEVSLQVRLEDFGRRGVLSAHQSLKTRIIELEKDDLFRKYKEKIGEIINGEVYQIWRKETLVIDDEGNELLMPKLEQIPSDFFKKGEQVKAIIKSVEMINHNPVITLSRTDASFLSKLLELEVPEIADGLIVIRLIEREPGDRAKVAVESFDERIDPVGACVGVKGTRIHGIVRELRNENIDIINFTNNLGLMIQRSLSPAKISSIELDHDKKRAYVHLDQDQVSLAIGRGGTNIKLATRLVGYELDIFRKTDIIERDEDDIELEEFADEIEHWMIEELKNIGCDTARSVLALDVAELVRRTDLEEEQILEIQKILQTEFD